MERDFSESTTSFLGRYKIVRDWRCGVRRVRVFDLVGNFLLTKEDVKASYLNGRIKL